MNNEGPKIEIKVKASCDGCRYETSEKYVCQSDWGYDHYCNHPSVGKKHFGESGAATPDFCPFKMNAVAIAVDEFIKNMKSSLPSPPKTN
jgi:hypothetical protein